MRASASAQRLANSIIDVRIIAQGHGSAGKHCRSAACEQCRRTDIAFALAICAITFRMSGRLSAAT